MKSKVSTHIGILFLKLVAKLPFICIYLLSDIFYLIIYYLVGYRKKVVLQNLKNSYPNKNPDELKKLTKRYFRHFSDITLETIKMYGMNKADFDRRMQIKNADLVNQYFEKGQSVVILSMHYNNWEWGSSFSGKLKHKCLGVFKPLHNSSFNSYLNNVRGKHGLEMVSNSEILRRIIKAKKEKELILIWLAGDQTPPYYHKTWYKFLNQETLFYLGTANIPHKFNYPVFFQNTIKTDRGMYQTEFELLFENPSEFNVSDIIKKYIEKMEEVLKNSPECYLWSHKRWKHIRPEGIPLN